ncbi:hypothetical protein NFI96_008644, partial [Prochilodus magdalenae]
KDLLKCWMVLDTKASQQERRRGSEAPSKRKPPANQAKPPQALYLYLPLQCWREKALEKAASGLYVKSDGRHIGAEKDGAYRVAIKIVQKLHGDRYFKRGCVPVEVALLQIMSQPPICKHIVQLIEWFNEPDRYILILELPEPCKSLDDFLEDYGGYVTEDMARIIMRQSVLAASQCHKRGVLHRDIKLENLLINPDTLELKLIDFGCGDFIKKSGFDSFAGTVEYCPPEFFLQGRYHAGPATVWSLGVLLFATVCGDLPFADNREIIGGRLHFRDGLSRVTGPIRRNPGPTAPAYGLTRGLRISSQYLMAVRLPLCEPAFICEEHRAPVVNLPILVFSGKCQASCMVLGCEHNPHLWTTGPHTILMESVSNRLCRHMHIGDLLEVILPGSGSAPPVRPCTKAKAEVAVLLLSCCPPTASSTSPGVLACLLISRWRISSLRLPAQTRVFAQAADALQATFSPYSCTNLFQTNISQASSDDSHMLFSWTEGGPVDGRALDRGGAREPPARSWEMHNVFSIVNNQKLTDKSGSRKTLESSIKDYNHD